MLLTPLVLAMTSIAPPAFDASQPQPCARSDAPLAVGVACEYAALARLPLWPGFEPAGIPLAVYDGKRTWLFRHPHPPEACHADATAPETSVCAGRLDGLTANTALDLGGALTATLMLSPDRSARDQAAIAIHEAFHAFQAATHPGWGGNEADLFVYPIDDAEALSARLLEDEALTRALRSTEGGTAAGWAAAALGLRHSRFARLGANAAAYERGTELKEGLAQYVEDRARDADPARRWPREGFAAERVRLRAYASGQTLAVLLERLDPAWRSQLDAKGEVTLDALLDRALSGRRDSARSFSADDMTASRKRAEDEVAAVAARRREALAAFEAQPGTALEIVAAAEPLWPQGFDPINVQSVAPTTVLHRRFLKLGNKAGAIEIIGRASLTEGVGPHPLFAGVRRLRLMGLSEPPAIDRQGDTITIRSEGVNGRFQDAIVERAEGLVRLRLAAAPAQ